MFDALTRHPHQVGETYGEHLATAASFGLAMIVAGLACLVHALLPFLFQHTASDCIASLQRRMAERSTMTTLLPLDGGGGPAKRGRRGWITAPAPPGSLRSPPSPSRGGREEPVLAAPQASA